MCPSKTDVIGLGTIITLILLMTTIIGIIILQDNKPKVGEEREFWAHDFTLIEEYEVNATLFAIGDYCYIYIENELITLLGGKTLIAEQADEICHEFDTVIYPRLIDLAGHPDGVLGDIDGDPRIFILFLESSVSYYIESNDLEVRQSNYCEIIYIDYQHLSSDWLYQVIAHELHHLIWFNYEQNEPPFMLEALAQYAMYHAGYLDSYGNLSFEVASYLSHPEDSPVYMNHQRDYGSAYLFAYYIAEKYGVQIIRDLITESAIGLRGVESVIQTAGYNITFNELYLNWLTALTLDERGIDDHLFHFEGCYARITSYDVINTLPVSNKTVPINHYAFHIHKLVSPPNNFAVSITTFPMVPLGIVFAIHDSLGWHVVQNFHYDESTLENISISGSFIEEAYIITSYISTETPTAPYQWDMQEPSIILNLTITEEI
jgi:hypothetical protein